MSLFGPHKIEFTKILQGLEDCHSHLLPGVDDGFANIEDSLEVLAKYEELGIRKVWFTPHVMEETPNTTEKLKNRFEEFQQAYESDYKSRESKYQKVELSLAAEYMMDNLFEDRLSKKDLILHGEHNLLVETSYFNPPYNLKKILSNVMSAGHYPILAHPERYVYMGRSDYDELKQMNVRFQMNLGSVVGMYGETAQTKALSLLKKSYYNYVGSDLHHKSQLEFLLKQKVKDFREEMITK